MKGVYALRVVLAGAHIIIAIMKARKLGGKRWNLRER